MPIIEAKHLRSQPGRNMNSVGDVSNRNLVFRLTRSEPGPHRPGYLAVQGGNCIGTARNSQTEHRHTEGLLLVVWTLSPQPHQDLLRKTELFAQRPKVLFDQLRIEA